MSLRNVSKKELSVKIIVFLLVLLVFFYDYFINYISYLDELLAVLCLGSMLFIKRVRLLRAEYLILLLLGFISIIGIVSNLTTYHKIAFSALSLDALSFYKAFIVYFGIRIYFKNLYISDVLPSLKKVAIYGFFILMAFFIYDYVLWVFPRNQRFGLFSFELFFNHPSRLSFAFSFIFIVLYPYFIRKWKSILILILFAGMITLRVKYLGFLLVSLIFIFNKKLIFGVNKKLIYALLALAPIVLFFIFKDWIMFYFSEGNLRSGWSRGILLRYSFTIAYDFFPLGTGFGSYASFFSGEEYSWVYDYYDLNEVWGISEKHHQFLADQYWPMVLGQFGVFGFIAMAGLTVAYIKMLVSKIKSATDRFFRDAIIAGLLGLILLLIDSTSDAIFSQNRGVVIFILLGLIINESVHRNKIKNNISQTEQNENITDK